MASLFSSLNCLGFCLFSYSFKSGLVQSLGNRSMLKAFLKILSTRFSLVLSVAASISALVILGLLPMAVESIIHDIKGIASKQQYFTEDLTDTGGLPPEK